METLVGLVRCVEDGLLLSHGYLLVMDGSAQDELLHQTDPGLQDV